MELNQTILGTLLGDGNISYATKESKNPRLRISHSLKNFDYVMKKYENVKEYCNQPPKEIVNLGWGKNLLGFTTKSHPDMKIYYELFYSGKKKVIKRETLNLINEEGLAYWYQDDGSFSGMLHIYTCAFSLEEHYILQKWLLENFGINSDILKDKRKNLYFLSLKREAKNKFCRMIEPYVVESMKYKLNFTDIKKPCEVCGNMFLPYRKSSIYCSKECQQKALHERRLQNQSLKKK